MKKYRSIILSLSLSGAFLAFPLNVNAQSIDPVTQAALDGYKQLLQENPNDYVTLYQRAAQYYLMKRYDDALQDLQAAIKATPDKDAEMKGGEYALISDIYSDQGDYKQALSAIDNALKLQSADYLMLYRKANLCLKLDKAEEAYQTFNRMLGINSRSQEAFFGMAQAQLMLKHPGEAVGLIEKGEALGKTSYQTYCRIGNIYNGAGAYADAAKYYLKAFSMAPDKPEPVQLLAELAKTHYPAVETGFNSLLNKGGDQAGMYYMLGRLSMATGHYQQADNCYTVLLQQTGNPSAAILAGASEAALYRDKLSEAQVFIDNALKKEQRADYFVLKSKIETALGNSDSAIFAAQNALKATPADKDASMALAEAYISARKGNDALSVLNDIITSDPSDVRALMLRAFVNFELINDGKAAVADYTRISRMETLNTFSDNSMRALAMALSGHVPAGDSLMKQLLHNDRDKTAEDYYDAAVYYAQTGNLVEGDKMAKKAVELGYENLYRLNSDKIANLTIAPIRHLMN